MTEHDELRILLGAYVLGGLDAADRAALETHLPTCARCRDELATFAPIPGLLRRVDPAEPRAAEPRPALPSSLLDQVRAERRRRTRRSVVQSGLAAVAAAAVVLGTVALTQGGATDHAGGSTVQAAAGSHTEGRAGYTAEPWGTAITLDLERLPATGHFVLVAVGSRGERDQAASWSATEARQAHLAGATSIPRTELIRVLVLAEPSGTTLATAGA